MDMRKDGAGFRILLAEDNFFNQQITTLTLQKRGYVVDIAGSGRQTIEKWMDNLYDLILMDLEMPDLDGLEAAEAIRRMEKEKGGHIPIFAVSAHSRASHMDKCIAAGMDDYIAKPIGADELGIKISNYAAKTAKTGVNGAAKGLLFDLSSLRGMFSKDEMRGLARLFLNRGKEQILEIGAAITKGDVGLVRLKAHQLKGSSSQFHADALTSVAARMEELAEKGEIAGADALFTDMKARFEEISKALEKEIEG
jgi:CheY-like chemotaxis protein